MRYLWGTLHDTMIEISFRVGTLKYVPLSVLKGNIDLVKDNHRLRAVLVLKYMNIMMIMGAKDVL
jgi:hypothetical protein